MSYGPDNRAINFRSPSFPRVGGHVGQAELRYYGDDVGVNIFIIPPPSRLCCSTGTRRVSVSRPLKILCRWSWRKERKGREYLPFWGERLREGSDGVVVRVTIIYDSRAFERRDLTCEYFSPPTGKIFFLLDIGVWVSVFYYCLCCFVLFLVAR